MIRLAIVSPELTIEGDMAEIYSVSGYDGDSEGEQNIVPPKNNKKTGRWTKEEVSEYRSIYFAACPGVPTLHWPCIDSQALHTCSQSRLPWPAVLEDRPTEEWAEKEFLLSCAPRKSTKL